VTKGVTVTVSNSAPSLTVKLTANPLQVAPGDVTKLTWTSTGAKWCWAHGMWGGERPLSGSATSPRNWQDRWYAISCSDGNQKVTSGVTVKVAPTGGGSQQLSVKLNASPLTVKKGASSKLSWTA